MEPLVEWLSDGLAVCQGSFSRENRLVTLKWVVREVLCSLAISQGTGQNRFFSYLKIPDLKFV